MKKLNQVNKQIETAAVAGYKKIEKSVVSGYRKVEDKFIDTFLAEEGETTEAARTRIMKDMEQVKQNATHHGGVK